MKSAKRKGRKKRNHICTIDHEVDQLAEAFPGNTRWARVKRGVMSLFIASKKSARTYEYFRSKEAIQQEIKLHLTTHFYMIHPLSQFSIFWETFVILHILIHCTLAPVVATWSPAVISMPLVVILNMNDVVMFIDIALHFFTGQCTKSTRQVEMGRKDVIRNYIKGMLGIDIIGAVPPFYFDIFILGKDAASTHNKYGPLNFLKIFRMVRFFIYFQHLNEVLDVSTGKQRCINLSIIFLFLLHFAACGQYHTVEWYNESAGTPISETSWLGTVRNPQLPAFEQYVLCLFGVSRLITGVCTIFVSLAVAEKYISICFIMIGQVLSYIVIANVMQVLKSRNSSKSKFEDLSLQLKQFLESKNLPRDLQRKAQEYYIFRYHKSFYNESDIMQTLSEQLRHDIILHNCQRLMENVPFFKDIPQALKERIVTRMRSKYYQSEDVIIKIDDIGDRMFFIKFGTVAVYSKAGKEICHLEDGNHFGEIALLMHGVKRVANIVAIEDCELYCLERSEFLMVLEPYPEVLKNMCNTAEARLKETSKMDGKVELTSI